MVIVKKEQNKILFQNPFKLMFNKYNKQCKVGECRNLSLGFVTKVRAYKKGWAKSEAWESHFMFSRV
jgi:hypothetical protein